MAVTYNTAVKTSRMTATRDYFANGTLEIQAADNTVLAIFGLSGSGGSVASGVWTLTFDSDTVSAESGAGTGKTATKAQIKTSGGSAHLTGLTVGLSASDVIVDNTSIASGQQITTSSATITHA